MSTLGMPGSSSDWGLDPNCTRPHSRCSPAWGLGSQFLEFLVGCSLGCTLCHAPCEPGLNWTAPQTSLSEYEHIFCRSYNVTTFYRYCAQPHTTPPHHPHALAPHTCSCTQVGTHMVRCGLVGCILLSHHTQHSAHGLEHVQVGACGGHACGIGHAGLWV